MDVSKKTKKILIFSFAYFPNVGGAEVAIKEITDRLLEWSFDLVALKMNKESPAVEKLGNVTVYRVDGGKAAYPILASLKALRLNRHNKYGIVWSVMAAYAGFAGLFFKIANPGTPFLLTLQEGDPEEHILKRVGFLKPLWKKIFRRADYVQAISGYLAEFGKKYGAVCPIEVVPNGVDVNRFQPSAFSFQEKSEVKRKLNLKPDDKILITTSRLVEKNGVGDLIESLVYLPEHVKLVVLGIGPLEGDLKFKIKNLKLEERVRMLGYKNHDEILKYLAVSDIFIRPSLSEGLGNSFLEAMAAGLPVIGTNVGGIPDFLKDPSKTSGQAATGLFCEVNNPKSIAEKAALLLGDCELRKAIITNGQKLVKEKYDWQIVAKKMEEIFNRLSAA